MQRKKRTFFRNIILTAFLSCLMLSGVQAAKPLWTLTPIAGSGPKQTVAVNGSTSIQYRVQNQSKKPKKLAILPIQGLQQAAPCYVTATGQEGSSCTLTLAVTGSALPQKGIHGGPALCQVNPDGSPNPNQCYRPSSANSLNISVMEVPPNTTLSPLAQNLVLSINSPGADPTLYGNALIIRIENTGAMPANNVQVSASGFPAGTSITNNDCTGTLNAGATCDITITPGDTASPDISDNACTTSPGTEPVPTTVTISADNAPSTSVNVLILGYGCIHQGGFLFSVDDSTLNTGSIAGKVAALTDEEESPGDFFFQWATVFDNTAADSITDGLANTNALANPAGQYPAAQACLNKNDQGFTDWFMPAICELGRFVGLGVDAGCGATNPNLYTTLHTNNLGGFASDFYWSSTEFGANLARSQFFLNGFQSVFFRLLGLRVRCVRVFSAP